MVSVPYLAVEWRRVRKDFLSNASCSLLVLLEYRSTLNRSNRKSTHVAKEFDLIGNACDAIERILTADVSNRGIIGSLYPLARSAAGGPPIFKAANLLRDSSNSGDTVFIVSGTCLYPSVLNLAESDGPSGAVVLARALYLGLGVIPILVGELRMQKPFRALLTAAGFKVTDLRSAREAAKMKEELRMVASVLPLSVGDKEIPKVAEETISRFRPASVISIERFGMNPKGVYHNSRGMAVSEGHTKMDYLFDVAKKMSIPTVGVGDFGNEIGMGVIRDKLKGVLKYGEKCLCPCGGGVVSSTSTDVLVTTTVSNWASYGISAALAMILDKPTLVHSGFLETQLLECGARVGLINGPPSHNPPYEVDNLPFHIHAYIAELAKVTAESYFSGGYFTRKM